MGTNKIIAEVEYIFNNKKKTIKMEFKDKKEIINCEEGSVIMLNLKDGSSPVGIFKGIDVDLIMLGSLSGKSTIGIKVDWLSGDYLEKIKKVKNK